MQKVFTIFLLAVMMCVSVCGCSDAPARLDQTPVAIESYVEDEGAVVTAPLYIGETTAFFGWDGKKNEKGRTLLQKVGTDAIRAQRPDYWVSFITDVMELFPEEWDYVLIPDCRFPNEVDYVKDAGFDTIHLRVVRKNFVSPLTPEQQIHPSETALDNVEADYYITNDGSLKDLQNSVVEWLIEINGQHQTTFEEL